MKELKDAQTKPVQGVSLQPTSDDLMSWEAVLSPQPPSLYENGKFVIKIIIPQNYPIAPPKFIFSTPICHPNIHPKSGEICLDILKPDSWSPAW